jgi:hypothetical protein
VFGLIAWPEAIFIGLFGACLATLCLAGWRFARPDSAPSTPANSTPKADGAERELNISDMAILEKRVTGALDGFKESVQSANEDLRTHLEVLERKVADSNAKIQNQQEALLAIYHRERMLNIAQGIDAKSLELGVPLANGKMMDQHEWEDWKRDCLQWESTVHQWANYARIYLGREPMDDIKRINSEGLDQNWGAKADQIPDPEGLRIYKTFRIYLRNYANIRDVVHEKVRRKAFEGVNV